MRISDIIAARRAAIKARSSYAEDPATVADIAERLERYGYDRKIAGGDFDRLCKASAKAETVGLCLLITGPVGCGKTTAAVALRPTARLIPMGGYIPNDFAASRADRINWQGWDKTEGEFATGRVIIDDLGQEPIGNNYGIRYELLADYIEWAYDRREAWCKGLPVITTNLSLDDIAKRYGARIDSRLAELCVSIKLGGGDRRKRFTR